MSKDDLTWGAKATPDTCALLDRLFSSSGQPTKKDYLEHLGRLDQANQIRKGTDTALSPELLKLSSGDLTELMNYTSGINKLYIRMIERAGIRENSLSNNLDTLGTKSSETEQALKKCLEESEQKLSDIENEKEELLRSNELLHQENKLIQQERVQHAESLRLKEEAIVHLNVDIAEKYKRIAELDEKIQSFEHVTREHAASTEKIKELELRLKETQKDAEVKMLSLQAEHQLEMNKAVGQEREAAHKEVSKYRDDLTAQLKAVVAQRDATEEKAQKRIDEYRLEAKQLRDQLEALKNKKPGRPPKS
ncbi:hypothetical protein WMW72_20355 [Paenibacillus filicis]|uniref:Uncharacterized protein n=1 Tax=Paenibacillus filicis TaxID=669464 RepID=A0ABU9DQA0_9BACL